MAFQSVTFSNWQVQWYITAYHVNHLNEHRNHVTMKGNHQTQSQSRNVLGGMNKVPGSTRLIDG